MAVRAGGATWLALGATKSANYPATGVDVRLLGAERAATAAIGTGPAYLPYGFSTSRLAPARRSQA